jgi:short-subunit dehydrogenase
MEFMALVTGGAQGLGKAVALRLMEKGYTVDILDRLPEPTEPWGYSSYFSLDLLETEGRNQGVHLVASGKYNVIVHAAGVGKVGSFASMSLESDEWVVALNVRATLALVKAFVQGVHVDEPARLILVSSMAGLAATPGMSVYAASKRFVCGLAESVDWELRLEGYRARVLAIAPPPLATAFRTNNGKPPRSKRMRGVLDPDVVAQDVIRLIRRPRQHRVSGFWNRFLFLWVRPWVPSHWIQRYVYQEALKD